MSTAPLSTCVECQLQQRLPALSITGQVACSFLKVSMLRKLPKWHLHQGIRLVMSKRFQISKWKQEPPSGLKNWERERTLVSFIPASSWLILSPISLYIDLSYMRSRMLELGICKELLLVCGWNIGCVMLWRELKKEFHSAGKEMLDWNPMGCISSWTLLLSIKLSWFFPICWCILYDCISIFDLLLILNHLWICIFAFVLCCSLVTGSCSLVISWDSSSCSLEQARRQVAMDTKREEDLVRGKTGRQRQVYRSPLFHIS